MKNAEWRRSKSGRRDWRIMSPAVTTHGTQRHDEPRYRENDVFVFGPETRGLPSAVIDAFPATQRLRVPMRTEARSLNLSNAVAIVVYEAWRQLGFSGGV